MLETEVLRDFRRLKVKLAFGLTKRQLLCFGGAAVIGFPLYFLMLKIANSTLAMLVMIIVMLPFFLLAMYERHGQPFEKVVKNFILFEYKRPKIRKYKTNNVYVNIETIEELRKEGERYVAIHETKTGRSVVHHSKGKANQRTKKRISTNHQSKIKTKK